MKQNFTLAETFPIAVMHTPAQKLPSKSPALLRLIGQCMSLSFTKAGVVFPVDTGRKLNVHKTFNLRLVSTGLGSLLQPPRLSTFISTI